MNMIEKSTDYKAAAILAGPKVSFLDHLIPICDLLKIPLICTEKYVHFCATFFYPSTIPIIIANEGNFQEILSPFDTFFTVEPCRLHPRALLFGEYLYQGTAKTIAGFHGNSDKFLHQFWIERYLDEDALLLYGKQNEDFFEKKGILNRIKKYVTIGNLRFLYYKKNQFFFDNVIQKNIFLPNRKHTLLYAPSWSFSGDEDDGTFFEHHFQILHDIPEKYRVIVKLHPYLFRLYPEKVREIMLTYSTYEHILFIDEMPLVYPWLNSADIYLGDYSSVGYDFLAMDRPLFFLTKKIESIQSVGTVITNPSLAYDFFERADLFQDKRKALYEYAFAHMDSLEEIKRKIETILG